MITAIQKALMEKAIGIHTGSTHKPVLCITDGTVYASVHDAADFNHGNRGRMSEASRGLVEEYKGKRWCYVADIEHHLPEIVYHINTWNTEPTQSTKKKVLVYKYKR